MILVINFYPRIYLVISKTIYNCKQWPKYCLLLTCLCNASILKTKYNEEQNKNTRRSMTNTDIIVDFDKCPSRPPFPDEVDVLLISTKLWPEK